MQQEGRQLQDSKRREEEEELAENDNLGEAAEENLRKRMHIARRHMPKQIEQEEAKKPRVGGSSEEGVKHNERDLKEPENKAEFKDTNKEETERSLAEELEEFFAGLENDSETTNVMVGMEEAL